MVERLFQTSDRFAHEIGHDYGAAAGSNVQADLLNGLAAGLMSIRQHGIRETQIYYVARDLTADARKVFKTLGEFCEEEE